MQTIRQYLALVGVIALAAGLTATTPVQSAENFYHRIPRDGATEEAPHTKSQIIDYLAKMRRVINQYDSTMMSIMGGGGAGGLKIDAGNLGAASAQTQRLAQEIAAIMPPKDIADEHNKLGSSMGAVDAFLANGGNSLTALPQAFALAGQVQQTHASYHTAVLKLIDGYGLNRSLDPFSDESDGAKAAAAKGLSDVQSQIMGDSLNFGSGSSGGLGGAAGGIMNGLGGGGSLGTGGGSLGSFGGGGAGGGMAGRSKTLGGPTTLGGSGGADSGMGGLGDLSGMLGGGGAGGMNLGDLGKMLGGGGAGGMGGLGKMLGGSGGGMGADGGDLGSLLKNIDLNGLMKQMGGGQAGTGSGSGLGGSNDPTNSGLDQ